MRGSEAEASELGVGGWGGAVRFGAVRCGGLGRGGEGVKGREMLDLDEMRWRGGRTKTQW